MGPRVEFELERHGFYPAGGGRFRVHIQPAGVLNGFDLGDQGEITEWRARVLVSNLPSHIGRREIDTIVANTGWDPDCCSIVEVDSAGPGNVVMLELASSQVTEVFTGFGQHGVKAERVAGDAVKQMHAYLTANVPVGPYLADQLMLPLGISAWQGGAADRSPPGRQRGGSYRTLPLSRHATTHIDILRRFLNIPIDVGRSSADGACTVRIGPPAA